MEYALLHISESLCKSVLDADDRMSWSLKDIYQSLHISH